MARRRNILNDKERAASCSATNTTLTYKMAIKGEKEFLGHYLEHTIEGEEIVFKFSVKKPSEPPAFRIEHFSEPQQLSFD